jgi:hypothetical protein
MVAPRTGAALGVPVSDIVGRRPDTTEPRERTTIDAVQRGPRDGTVLAVPEELLTCHPRTPTGAVRGIVARGSRTAAGVLALSFSLDGELARLRIPAPRTSGIGRELWRHTCFEAFVGPDGSPAYHELNLSPSGEWTVLAFDRYRHAAALADDAVAPRLTVRRLDERLELDAEIALAGLGHASCAAPLRLALAAVVEEMDGALSYWSLHHPPGRPDFHHRDAFVLTLERPAGAC